jgi:hypothetical protein
MPKFPFEGLIGVTYGDGLKLPCCCFLPAVVGFPAVGVPAVAGNPNVAVAHSCCSFEKSKNFELPDCRTSNLICYR